MWKVSPNWVEDSLFHHLPACSFDKYFITWDTWSYQNKIFKKKHTHTHTFKWVGYLYGDRMYRLESRIKEKVKFVCFFRMASGIRGGSSPPSRGIFFVSHVRWRTEEKSQGNKRPQYAIKYHPFRIIVQRREIIYKKENKFHWFFLVVV